MTNLRVGPWMSLWFLLACAPAAASETEVIFPETIYMDATDERADAPAQDYFALHKRGAKFFLSEAKVRYRIFNEEFAEPSSDVSDVVVYIRGTGFRAGEVATGVFADGADPDGMAIGIAVDESAISIGLGSHVYQVGPSSQGIALKTPRGHIDLYPGYPNPHYIHILWAGDMDRDGNLDLVVDLSDPGEKFQKKCVWLSSSNRLNESPDEGICELFGG